MEVCLRGSTNTLEFQKAGYDVKRIMVHAQNLESGVKLSVSLVPSEEPLIPDMTVTGSGDDEAEVGKWLRFEVDSSSLPSGSEPECIWDFGDGTQRTGTIVYHRFCVPGQYETTLVVSTSEGSSGQTSEVIEVGWPAPGSEIVHFYDAFDAETSAWYTSTELPGPDHPTAVGQQEGEYRIGITRSETLFWSWAPLLAEDGTAEAEVILGARVTNWAGLNGAVGLVWGVDNDNLVALLVSTHGWFSVDERVDGQWQSVVPWTACEASFAHGSVISAVLRTETAAFYIDGHPIGEAPAGEFSQVGIASMSADEGGFAATFGEFCLFALPAACD